MLSLAPLVVLLLGQLASGSLADGSPALLNQQLRGRRHLFEHLSSPTPPVPPPASSPVASNSCPEPTDGICTKEYAPVACGPNDCEYSNRCIATLAGFVADDDCESTRTKPPACPLPESAKPCYMIFAPVVCGPNDCQFDNQCFADAAGFTEADCTATGTPPPETSSTCPTPDGSEPCTLEYMPVACGPDGCEYDNRCIAGQAGFSEDECKPK